MNLRGGFGKEGLRDRPGITGARTGAKGTIATGRSSGAEVSIFNVFFLRRGFVDDPEGDVVGSTVGWGVGLDLDLSEQGGAFGRVGFRYDRASVPQARGLDHVTHQSATVWFSAK